VAPAESVPTLQWHRDSTSTFRSLPRARRAVFLLDSQPTLSPPPPHGLCCAEYRLTPAPGHLSTRRPALDHDL